MAKMMAFLIKAGSLFLQYTAYGKKLGFNKIFYTLSCFLRIFLNPVKLSCWNKNKKK